MFLIFRRSTLLCALRDVVDEVHEFRRIARRLIEEVRTMSTTLQDVTRRLKAVQATQDKTIAEISAAKDEISALKSEVARLTEIIANAGDGIPPAVLQELQDAVSAVEQRAQAIDSALPDLPPVGVSPPEGTSPEEGTSPSEDAGEDSGSPVEAGSGSEVEAGTTEGVEPAPADDTTATNDAARSRDVFR